VGETITSVPEARETEGRFALKVHIKEMNEGRPRIPIVIPVANVGDEITGTCLEHLSRSTRLPLKVILVESSGEEFSYGRSMNAGIRCVDDYDVVIGMDSDAFPEPGSMERMLTCLRSDSRIGYVGAKIYSEKVPPRMGWVHSNVLWFLWDSLRHGWVSYAIRRLLMGGWWSFSVRSPRDYVPGKMVGALTTMFALRRKCFEEVGPMDERYRVAFVDVDYCYRILISRNWYLTSCPSAVVFHKYHETLLLYGFEKGFEGWKLYLRNWPKDRIKLVLYAAKRGKFLIPPDR